MDAEPHTVGCHAFKFVAMLADLGYRGIPTNHRHDPFIMVVKWGPRCAFDIGQNIPSCPSSSLLRNRSKLGQSFSVLSSDVSEVSDRIDAREALDAEIVLDLDSSAATLRQAQITGDRRSLESCSPD